MVAPMRWGSAPYDTIFQADAERATGRVPVVPAILAVIGQPQFNAGNIGMALGACKATGKLASVWASPPANKLDIGGVALDALPDHWTIGALADLLAVHGDDVMVRAYYECANPRKDGKGLRYESPTRWRNLVERFRDRMPANAKLVMSYGPNPGKFNPAEWEPKAGTISGFDCSLWGRNHINPKHPAGENAARFMDFAASRKLPLVVGECGAQPDKDWPGLSGDALDEAMREYFKDLHALCLGRKARILSGPYPSDDFGMVVPWTTLPKATAYMKKALGNPAFFMTQPLVGSPAPVSFANLSIG